jgi:hypothetical protein
VSQLQRRLINLSVIFYSITMGTMGFSIERSEVSSRVLYRAVDQLTDYLAQDFAEISKHAKKTAVINYTQSEQLPASIQHYMIKRLEFLSSKNKEHPIKFLQCIQCVSLHAVAEGDEVFIRKGITDDKQLKTVMKDLDIRKYSDINLAYTGDQLVLHASLVDQNKIVDWSAQYKTPYKSYDDSQWMMGIAAQVGAYQGDGQIPAAKGGRAAVGQRLTGFGAAGLTLSYFQQAPGVPQVISYGTFVNVSHNEMFNQYWDFHRLSYLGELGITDFNGNQLIHETIGVKSVIGKHYTVSLSAKFHQFISEPVGNNPILNPEGEPVLLNNQPLPMMISLGLGFELL